MNLSFLGDALDHWKGSLFESMQSAGVLRHFAVDPMASDLPSWRDTDFSLFAQLVRVDVSQIISHRSTLANRRAYFAEISHPGDLFLDPDTGISTGARATPQHLAPAEVRGLIEDSDRLLCVYQHVRAQRVCDRVDAVCAVIRREVARCYCSSYESGTVAMLFLSRSADRPGAVADHFRRLLGRHANGRIRIPAGGGQM
jgi:hypothetical protein